jgi:actin-related protein 9
MFFERFNVAGFAVIERPMAQMYAANSLSGLVVDVGHDNTDVTPIYDGFVVHGARTSLPIGTHDCEHYLANLLRPNQSISAAFSPPDTPIDRGELHKILLELVNHLLEQNLIKVRSDGETAVEDDGVTDIAAVLVAGREKAVIESGMKKKATAKASAAEQARAREIEALDLVTVEFRGHSLTLGRERHRFCEPLFDPSLLNGLYGVESRNATRNTWSLQDAVGHAVGQTEVDQRQYILGGLFVTGELTKHVKGLIWYPG